MDNLFLDTNIYIKAAFRFSSIEFRKLEGLIKMKKINLVIPDLVIAELNNNIKKHFEEKVNPHLNKVLNDPIVKHINTNDVGKIEYFKEKGCEMLINNTLDWFKSLAEIVKIDSVDLSNIISDYKNLRSPFSLGKKEEWKDALILNWLKQKYKYKNLIVISDDEDFKSFSSQNRLVFYPSVNEYFKANYEINNENPIGFDNAINNFVKSLDEIINTVFGVTIIKQIENKYRRLGKYYNFNLIDYKIIDRLENFIKFNVNYSCNANWMESITEDEEYEEIVETFTKDGTYECLYDETTGKLELY